MPPIFFFLFETQDKPAPDVHVCFNHKTAVVSKLVTVGQNPS